MGSEVRVLEQPRRLSAQDASEITKRTESAYPDKASVISGANGAQDWGARQVREWLLLLLRFAVTADAKDQSAALALADEIDALGLAWRPSAPTFFRRTTSEVCKAITALDDPKRTAVLKRHIARIDNPALRRAFQAAVHMEERLASPRRKRQNLWSGLRR
jgi:hypothetical protein